MSNEDSGFIKVYRSFFDHFLWDEDREYSKAEAWIDLLRTARYSKENKTKIVNGNVVEWGRGELLASVRFLKERWNWNSTGKVTRFLDLLEKQNMVERKTEQGVTVVSICNYSTYNDYENGNRTGTEREQNEGRTGTEQRQGQNSKKVKKDNKGNSDGTPDYEIPTKSQVEAYFREQGKILEEDIPLEAEKFINHYEDMDWRKNKGNGKRIDNWHRQAGTWAANYQQFNRDKIDQKKRSNGQMSYHKEL